MFFTQGDPATVTFDAYPAGAINRMIVVEPDWQIKVATKRQ
jgi:hypothetical protein